MIIQPREIVEVERLIERCDYYDALSDDEALKSANPADPVFFADRPHLLMPLGYDEFRAIKVDFDDLDAAMEEAPVDAHLAFDRESFYRDSASGAWYWYEGLGKFKDCLDPATGEQRHSLHFWGPAAERRYFPVAEWLTSLRALARQPPDESYSFLLPRLWTPGAQIQQEVALAKAMPQLITDVAAMHVELSSLSWRSLEELVAELLRDRGLQVHVTRRSRDGGRDIIARGELISGEPVILAVEVKQKPVVGIVDVQRALRANEDFPALLLATAGRFSAGVIRERSRNRNRFRLFLKDGIAVRQWIDAYLQRRRSGLSSVARPR